MVSHFRVTEGRMHPASTYSLQTDRHDRKTVTHTRGNGNRIKFTTERQSFDPIQTRWVKTGEFALYPGYVLVAKREGVNLGSAKSKKKRVEEFEVYKNGELIKSRFFDLNKIKDRLEPIQGVDFQLEVSIKDLW